MVCTESDHMVQGSHTWLDALDDLQRKSQSNAALCPLLTDKEASDPNARNRDNTAKLVSAIHAMCTGRTMSLLIGKENGKTMEPR